MTPWHTHTHRLVLPYKGIQGEHKLKHIKRENYEVLPEDKNMQLVYAGNKLETKFNVNNKPKKKHHRNLTNSVKCPMKNCRVNGETGRRQMERVN